MQFDVVIIGASTSGLHAAQKLASAGKKVAVFDRQKELKPARRTLIVTPEIRKVLKGLPPEAILNQTGTMVLVSPQLSAQVSLQDPDVIVERAAITRWLLSRTQSAGGEIFLGYRFDGFVESNHGIQVRFENPHAEKTVVANEAIIGADGMTSDVAQAAGIPRPSSVPILQAEVTLPPGWNPDVTQVWFDADDTRFFYWLIPESAERGVVGLVGDDGTRTQHLLETFLNRHHFEPETYQGAKVAMHHPRFKPWGRVGNTPVYLVGDAAGQVKTTTVGGTITGFQGAEAAVASILDGQSYRAALRSVKRELDLHWLIRLLLDRLDNRGYDLLVGAVKSRLAGFLAHHNRDSMAAVVWRLPFVEPTLIHVVLRCLVGKSKRVWGKPTPDEPATTSVTQPES